MGDAKLLRSVRRWTKAFATSRKAFHFTFIITGRILDELRKSLQKWAIDEEKAHKQWPRVISLCVELMIDDNTMGVLFTFSAQVSLPIFSAATRNARQWATASTSLALPNAAFTGTPARSRSIRFDIITYSAMTPPELLDWWLRMMALLTARDSGHHFDYALDISAMPLMSHRIQSLPPYFSRHRA